MPKSVPLRGPSWPTSRFVLGVALFFVSLAARALGPATGRETTTKATFPVGLTTQGGTALPTGEAPSAVGYLKEVRVSRRTPPWLRSLVEQARDEWARMDARLGVPIIEVAPGFENIAHRETSEPDHVGETRLGGGAGPEMVIWPGNADAYSVVLHELGHALCGCGDHLEAGVMQATSARRRFQVTPRDVELVLSRRLAAVDSFSVGRSAAVFGGPGWSVEQMMTGRPADGAGIAEARSPAR